MVSRRAGRRGSSTMGCLVSLVIFAALIYYGTKIGEHYWNFYQLQDEMRSQARLAPSLNDQVIRRRVLDKADELNIMITPRDVKISRGGRPPHISIESEYSDSVSLPLFRHVFVFTPKADEPL
jgi:hypothetical protein